MIFEQLLDFVPDGVVAVAGDGQIAYANRRADEMFGFASGELVGRPIEAIFADKSIVAADRRAAYLANPHTRLMRKGRVLTVRRLDGSEFAAEIALSHMPTHGGDLVVAAVRDVSARGESARELQLKHQLEQARRLESVGQLAGGVAHDFNNLLGVIINLCDFVDAELPADGQARADVDEIRAAARRGAALTRQLLIFSRRDIKRLDVLEIDEVIADLQLLLRRAIGESIEMTISATPGLWHIEADRGQIEQILVNLAVNARDAMPRGGSLAISTHNLTVDPTAAAAHFGLPPGRYVRLMVSDTGTGMPPEVIDRAFEPFFTTKPQGQGTGLGLATVYGIVMEAGGRIAIFSEPELGTSVKIYLPASDAPVSTSSTAATAPPHGNGEVILLVEDEDELRQITERILVQAGYRVVAVGDGQRALERVGEQDVDLLITDVVMPGLVGPELVQRIRTDRPDLRVIYITGYDHSLLRREMIDGDDQTGFLEKPFCSVDLSSEVYRLLRSPAQTA